MAKINQKEYEILKSLDDRWKWIARDERYEDLFAHPLKPIKQEGGWVNINSEYDFLCTRYFQFIKWEDSDPYSISELIEEYEREETEVDKQKLIEKWESAIEAAEFYGKGKEERLIGYMKDFVSDLKQLDEPEVLSQEWIVDNVSFIQAGRGYVLGSKLQNLLVPKQELPVIPKFVADFLNERKDWALYEIFDDEWLYEEHDRVAKWLYNNDELTNKQREVNLVMAHDCGYTVEEEQRYYVVKSKGLDGVHHYFRRFNDEMEGLFTLPNDKQRAFRFDDKEKAQAIADFTGSVVEEMEE